ncbi:MAG: hypothetical protein ACRDL2_15895 [Gaiellaceae bacterium]
MRAHGFYTGVLAYAVVCDLASAGHWDFPDARRVEPRGDCLAVVERVVGLPPAASLKPLEPSLDECENVKQGQLDKLTAPREPAERFAVAILCDHDTPLSFSCARPPERDLASASARPLLKAPELGQRSCPGRVGVGEHNDRRHAARFVLR